MQPLALQPRSLATTVLPASLIDAVSSSRRTNAFARFDDSSTSSPEQLFPSTDASSAGESQLSRANLDPAGSKAGPGRVQSLAELKAFFLGLYPQKMAEKVADDTGLSVDAVRKWFFRKPQREPNFVSRQRLARVYGAALAAEAGIPIGAWREAFLYPHAIEDRAA